ncbi:MAG: efflux RND transporter periplasmic adaptor subunit [Chitinophagia bacterium]
MKTFLTILLTTIILTSCGTSPKPTIEKNNVQVVTASNKVQLTKEQVALAQLAMAPIQQGKMKGMVHLNGVVDVPPTGIASVSIPMGGYVQDINLIPGTYVKKGQVLATVKDPAYVQLQENYLAAKAKLIYLQEDLDRQKTLLTQEAVSKKSFQQIQSDYNSNAIQIKALSEQLKLINIQPDNLTTEKMTSLVQLVAPISGYVTKVNINRGKYVTPSDVLLEIMDPNDIHAAITIYESAIAGFKVGMKGTVSLTQDPSKKYAVTIKAVSQNINEDKTGLLHCHFDQIPKNVLPGMFLSADLVVENNEAVLIPIDAVQRFQGKDFIFIQSGANEFEAIEIQVSQTNADFVTVSNADATKWIGKSLVVKNAFSLLGKLMNKSE